MAKPLKKEDFMRTMKLVFNLSLVVIITFSLSGCKDNSLSSSDSSEIYQLIIRKIYLEDNSFGKAVSVKHLYILKDTNDNIGDEQIPELPSQRIADEVMEGINLNLSDLPLEIMWIDTKAKNKLINWQEGGTVKDGAIITLGNIRVENNSTVYVSTGIYFANVAGSGRTYILERNKGTWVIIGDTGGGWIS